MFKIYFNRSELTFIQIFNTMVFKEFIIILTTMLLIPPMYFLFILLPMIILIHSDFIKEILMNEHGIIVSLTYSKGTNYASIDETFKLNS